MKDTFAASDEVILLANAIPEPFEHDPFEDEAIGEVVLLDVVRLDIADLEVMR